MDIGKLFLKFIWRDRRPRILLKTEVRRLLLHNLNIYYKTTVIKTVWYWQENRQTDQWNRVESPEIDPHKYSQLIFDKGAKTVPWKKLLFATNSAGIKRTFWHHLLDERESEWTPAVGDGQGGLACCDSWGCKESHTTERLIWSDLMYNLIL